MSAKRAAEALLEHDADAARAAWVWTEIHDKQGARLVRALVGTWSLSLAAKSAGVTEYAVLAAVLRAKGYGSLATCREIVDMALDV